MPSVHCVTRSCTKLTMIRGENCMEASVSVISRIANTIETTVMIEPAIPARIICATCGSARDGKIVVGIHALTSGDISSIHDSTAPAHPSASAIVNGRTRNPPRKLYAARRNKSGIRVLFAPSPLAPSPARPLARSPARPSPARPLSSFGCACGFSTGAPV